MKRVLILLTLGFLLASLFLTGCRGQEIRVGSKIGPESLLLAQMVILILEENGYKVIDMTPTGSTEETWRALINKDIDICPEYTGNYGRLVNELGNENKNEIVWLKPAPANNKWGIAIKRSLSEKIKETITIEQNKNKQSLPDTINNLPEITGKTMSEFAFATDIQTLNIKLICSPEFVTNPEALPKFQDEYKFELKPEQMKIFPSTNTAYLAKMADEDINAFMVYTTDAHLEKYDLVPLEDDQKAQNDFHPAPIMRKEYYNESNRDKINRILTPLFTSLDDDTLSELNSKIGLSGSQAISEVARQYLVENGFFKYNEFQMVQNAVEELMIQNDVEKLWNSTNEEEISDMSVFPKNTNDKLYYESKTVSSYITNNTTWSYITWKNTIGTYTCDSEGRVKQVKTGW